MSLERLANELLLDLFEYLPAVHLLHAFDSLNTRFNTLLFIRFQNYHLDFRSTSKRDFDTVCQRYLPLIADRVLSLTLADGDETPEQVDSFLSCGLTLRHLTNLRSLRLSHLRSTVVMRRLMTECRRLPCLTRLDLIDCSFSDEHQSVSSELNDIWCLPKLVSCHLDIHIHRQIYIIQPAQISTSLRSLSIESYCYGRKELGRLLQNTPCLRYLDILLRDDSEDQPLPLTVPSLVTLKVSAYESPVTLTDLLRNTPNLRHLTVETDEINWTGYDWERLIVQHLPQLTVLQLKMIFRLNDNDDKERRVDELLGSFRTRFWLVERQWHIRCDWDRCDLCEKNNIYLYTLPYAFRSYFLHEGNSKSKSTRLADDDVSSYDRVRTLGYELVPSGNALFSFFRFRSLSHLDLYLPFDDHFFTLLPNFDRLISLQVGPYDADHDLDCQGQLQPLLDRAPRLCSLTFKNWSSSSDQRPPYGYANSSLRQLHLQDVDRWYNTEQCATLSHSLLGRQCEVLSITVENRRNILELIDSMSTVRALNVICRDDTWMTDELIDWLRRNLPLACTITRNDESIEDRHRLQFKAVRIWVR